jgi:ketosteroid isomerase-like protein
MSEENVEIVRRAFDAYERGDVDQALADFAADCEYIASGAIPGRTGVFRGPEGYREFIDWLRSEFDDAHAEVIELIAVRETVVVGSTLRGRGRQSRASVEFTFWQVWTVHDGEVVRGQGFLTRDEALEAAGLSE